MLSLSLLIYAFIISDFSLQNVFFNSSTITPLIFKLAGSWASHEGSLLMLLCLLNIVSYIYISLLKNNIILIYAIRILSCINILFLSFIYFTSNPFQALLFIPSQGLGLNPTLQDIALSIHPPILYIGYVCYIVPFVNSCIILLILKEKKELLLTNLLAISCLFCKFAILFLTLGIALGSWWAYRELGWGGYWFFDPVENISLIVWLAGIALYHSINITLKYGNLYNWVLFLSIITFLLTICGTFLVRSGFLTSVHSFAATPERALYLFFIFSFISFPSIFLLAWKGQTRKFNNSNLFFQEKGIILGNILWLVATFSLICAILYPFIYFLIYKQSIEINNNYFIYVFLPIIITILFITAIFSRQNKNSIYFFFIICSLIITWWCTYKINCSFISKSAIVCSIFLILQTIHTLLIKTHFFRLKLLPSHASMIMGHLGFGLLALSISLNTILQTETDYIGKINDLKKDHHFEIRLNNLYFAEERNYYRQIAEFWIYDMKNDTVTILKPENRLYKIEKSLSQESHIFSYLFYDLYAVLNKIEGDIIHAKIYYRPMISFIWLSIIIISGGFVISFFNKKNINI